ncbi:uncharacterized protein METZ01_LOCUS179879, partial [marine metagenome]
MYYFKGLLEKPTYPVVIGTHYANY